MKINDWNIEEMTGYKPKTTFFTDFSIADNFGIAAIRDTYDLAFRAWKNDVVFITELVMVLNWKIWEHNEMNRKYAEVYNELWEKLDIWCQENFKGDDLSYFYRTTD